MEMKAPPGGGAFIQIGEPLHGLDRVERPTP
jgi:hypothetical protein